MELIKDDIDFAAYGQDQEQHNVRSAGDYLAETIEAFYPSVHVAPAPRPLWDKCKDKIAFRKGEVTLWAGINGHGKSMFLSQVVIDLMKQGERVLVLSFEMLPVRQMQRMARQAFAGELPSRDFISRFHEWTDGRLWIYDHVGSVQWQKVMAVCRYATEKFGITHFVVDSLMKCVKGEADYDAQKDFVDALCAFSQANKVHCHLVHHVRKGESEEQIPGKFDARGASAITDMVDNVIIVWRNKKAERGEKVDDPTAVIKCDKQRNGEWEGRLGFWFDLGSMQYLEKPGILPIRYELI